jgi:broad specificity phosphatase PhoE
VAARLLVTRHGQTVWHAENRYAGTSEVGLTPEGLRQAGALAGYARSVRPGAIACSPQERARLTAWPAADALGLPADVWPDLREAHFGVGEGRTREELAQEAPDVVEQFLRDPVEGAFPGAEPPAAVAARGARALRGIAERADGETVLVVAHNTLLRLTLCELLGIPLRAYRTVFPRLDNVAVTELRIEGGRTGLLGLNLPVATRYWAHGQ